MGCGWVHEGFRVPDGARKSKRDTPTYVGVCVWVLGVGHAHLPCLAHGTGQTGAAKAAATHAICVHPSGLTKGRLEER